MTDEEGRAGAFEEVLCAWGWWDCPRSGVALVDGEPHRFDCAFSEALDDHPGEFVLWRIDAAQLDQELTCWATWVDWRSRFDAGEPIEPFEARPDFVAFRDAMARLASAPPETRRGIPEWQLDRNRSFAGRVPQHFVRWNFVGWGIRYVPLLLASGTEGTS